jgi:hypothetical protein
MPGELSSCDEEDVQKIAIEILKIPEISTRRNQGEITHHLPKLLPFSLFP